MTGEEINTEFLRYKDAAYRYAVALLHCGSSPLFGLLLVSFVIYTTVRAIYNTINRLFLKIVVFCDIIR